MIYKGISFIQTPTTRIEGTFHASGKSPPTYHFANCLKEKYLLTSKVYNCNLNKLFTNNVYLFTSSHIHCWLYDALIYAFCTVQLLLKRFHDNKIYYVGFSY
jgi:hypothetical protein